MDALPDNSAFVAVEDDAVIAVGSVTDAGHIALDYVSICARFRGANRTLFDALEARAMERGSLRCTLNSTETARAFYLANGYIIDGLPTANTAMRRRAPHVHWAQSLELDGTWVAC